MMKYTIIVLALAMCGFTGCTALKATYQSNAQLIAGVAGGVTGPACAGAVARLKPGEAVPICTGLTACAQAICASPAGH